jgi:hypothetical protein
LVAAMRGPLMLVAAMDPMTRIASDPRGIRPTPSATLMPFYRVKDEVYTTYLTKT